MRLGVLDIGSNTGHLLVVDAHRGAAPLPAFSHKAALRLSEHLDQDGAVLRSGIDALVGFVAEALAAAEDKGCESVVSFATSAVRDAPNADDVLAEVHDKTGIELSVLPGSDEARLTFLAARRWFGWSSGRLILFDIGGGSLEVAAGAEQTPDVEQSLPLGAGRLTREWLLDDPADDSQTRALRRHVRAEIAREAGAVLRGGQGDRYVATSKTFRSLARVCGAAPSADGPFVRRVLSRAALQEVLPRLFSMTTAERAELPGVSAARARQLVAGGLVADAVMDIFEVEELEICPWALREGVILDQLDQMARLP
jgi:exopolyphosphatase/guanosine-5'-triphosphate,3'-diphosphate pyrophosphatase